MAGVDLADGKVLRRVTRVHPSESGVGAMKATVVDGQTWCQGARGDARNAAPVRLGEALLDKVQMSLGNGGGDSRSRSLGDRKSVV